MSPNRNAPKMASTPSSAVVQAHRKIRTIVKANKFPLKMGEFPCSAKETTLENTGRIMKKRTSAKPTTQRKT